MGWVGGNGFKNGVHPEVGDCSGRLFCDIPMAPIPRFTTTTMSFFFKTSWDRILLDPPGPVIDCAARRPTWLVA